MYKTDNTIKVIIGKTSVNWDIASTSGATPDMMDVGEVSIMDESGALIVMSTATNLDASDSFTLYQMSNDSTLNISPKVKIKNVTKLSRANYVAPANQVDYIGYGPSATTSTIDTLANNMYTLNIAYKQDKEMWSEQQNRRIYTFQSATTPTGVDVAKSLTAQVNADGFTGVSAVIVTPAGTETVVGSTVTGAVNNGSDIVTTSGVHGLTTTGGLLRIGGTGATYPVYVITEIIDTTHLRIHTPYQGTTAATAVLRTVTAYTYVGIKLTGLDLPWKDRGLFKHNMVFWDLSLINFGTTTHYNATKVGFGSGAYHQVRDLEWFSLGGDGALITTGHPWNEGRSDADSAMTYDTFVIEYVNTDDVYAISGTKPSRGQIIVFSGTTSVTYPNYLIALLESATGLTCVGTALS